MRLCSPTGLYWSLRGEVACPAHVPQADDPRWEQEQWTPLPEMYEYVRATRYRCQHCAPEGTPLVAGGGAAMTSR